MVRLNSLWRNSTLLINKQKLYVAQLGRARYLGYRGCTFESYHIDQRMKYSNCTYATFIDKEKLDYVRNEYKITLLSGFLEEIKEQTIKMGP